MKREWIKYLWKREWTKYLWLAFAGLLGIALFFTAYPRLGQKAPSNVVYFPAGYDSHDERELFVVTTEGDRTTVQSGDLDCVSSSATATSPFDVGDRGEFTCGSHLLQLHRDGTKNSIVAIGLAGLTPPFIVGSGRPLSPEENGTPRFVYRGPAVAVRHLIAHPAAACGGALPPEAAFCAENGGATGSMLVFGKDDSAARPSRGGRQIVSAGDILWLGYVPFLVERNEKSYTLRTAPDGDGRSWRTQRGNRTWMGLELPSWSLAQRLPGDPPAINRVLRENVRYSPGNLTEERSEPEQEEQLQLVIDEELLCLDVAPDAAGLHPRLAWRGLAQPGCSDLSLGSVRTGLADPPSEAAVRAYEQVQSEPRFGDLLRQVSHALDATEFTRDSESVLLYDYRYVQITQTGEQTLIRLPAALLGVRPNITLNRIRPPKVSTLPEVRFANASTSPLLEPSLPNADRIPMLLLASRGEGRNPPPPMLICREVGFGQRLEPLPAVMALGALSISNAGLFWTLEAGQVRAAECIELARQGPTVAVRSRGSITAVRQPADGSAEIRIGATPIALASGDRLRIDAIEFTFREASDVAAKDRPAGKGRQYPFGADASSLLGIRSLSHGVEGSMTLALRRDLEERAMREGGNAAPPLHLTIDGDLQRIVSRQLSSRFAEVHRERLAQVSAGRLAESDLEMRAAAVLLDAETGAILASATAPRFDWHEPADSRLLQQAATGPPSNAFNKRIENTAFLRNLPIGSTMKVATSIAMMRGGIMLENNPTRPNGRACGTLTVRQANGARRDPFDCDHGSHNVMTADGKPDPRLWIEAFDQSCNVYFGAAAGQLVPSLANEFSYESNGPVVTIPSTFDPSVALRPISLATPATGPSNSFYETLLLLGYRFDFEDRDAIDNQRMESYRGIRLPTVDDPWLQGFEPGEAFTYPTVTPPELFTNQFRVDRKRGAVPQLVVNAVDVAPMKRQPRWREQRWMLHYLETGWGHIMQGSPLAIAASAIPALQSAGAMRSPQLLVSALQRGAPPQTLLDRQQQRVLQAGLQSVLTGAGANPDAYNRYHTPTIARAARYSIGGKSGTIDLDGPPPPGASYELVRRARHYGCGVVNATFDQKEWTEVLAEAGNKGDGKYAPLIAEHASLPPWGFAAATSYCTALNPGMPRAPAASMSAAAAVAWNALPLLARSGKGNEPENSSAFVTALWPDDERPEGRRLILAVTFEHHSEGAKSGSARITNEILRLLQTRRQ